MGRHSEQPSLTATPVDGHANGTRCHVPGRDIALFVDRSEDRSAEHAYGDEPAAQKVDGISTDVDSVILLPWPVTRRTRSPGSYRSIVAAAASARRIPVDCKTAINAASLIPAGDTR